MVPTSSKGIGAVGTKENRSLKSCCSLKREFLVHHGCNKGAPVSQILGPIASTSLCWTAKATGFCCYLGKNPLKHDPQVGD